MNEQRTVEGQIRNSDERDWEGDAGKEENFPKENRSAKLDENAEWVKKHVEEFGEMPGFF